MSEFLRIQNIVKNIFGNDNNTGNQNPGGLPQINTDLAQAIKSLNEAIETVKQDIDSIKNSLQTTSTNITTLTTHDTTRFTNEQQERQRTAQARQAQIPEENAKRFKSTVEGFNQIFKVMSDLSPKGSVISKASAAVTKYAGPVTDLFKNLGLFSGQPGGVGRAVRNLFSGQAGRDMLSSLGFGLNSPGQRVTHWLRTGRTLSQYTPAGKATLGLASAAMGGLEGYSMGQSYGGLGMLGGTVSGALTGAMALGVPGAIIGGASGLIGGLIGWLTGSRSKKELKRLETVTKKAEAGLTNASYQVDLVESQAKRAKYMNELQEVKSRADNVVYLDFRRVIKKAV